LSALPADCAQLLVPPALGAALGVAAAVVSVRLPAEGVAPAVPMHRALAMGLAGLALGAWASLTLPWPMSAVGALLAAALLLIAVIDAEHFWLPNILTLPLGAAGLAASAFIGPGRFVDHVLGAGLGFAVLAGLAAAYKRLRGRDGLGGGDARLLAALGAWVGWAGLPSVVVWASLAGLSWVLARIVARRAPGLDTALPYGTYLAIGAWLTWLYGPIGRAGW
jgi:leader peptidase (prepilin peptidase)/N-methyltransferase